MTQRRATTVGRNAESEAEHDSYLALVKRFPLRPLRNAVEYDAAAALLDTLVLRSKLSEGEKDYLEGLSLFIEDYDRRHAVFDTRGRTPLDMLVHLMDANEMTVTDLGEVLGSKGVASEVLHGKRALSKGNILKLARRFGVDAGLFLDKPDAARAFDTRPRPS